MSKPTVAWPVKPDEDSRQNGDKNKEEKNKAREATALLFCWGCIGLGGGIWLTFRQD